MRYGITFPTYEIGNDPGAIRAFAQAAMDLGYDHVVAYEHVVGAGITRNEKQDRIVHGDYGYSRNAFHEPFVLFGFLAACSSLELVTSVLILPQRQTILVAKQAAEVDVLTQGKLRLGIGTGWNIAEYEALGVSYSDRGKLIDEQIAVLRQVWTQPFSSYSGRYHCFNDVGINPMPVQQPIPLWLGGSTEIALRRVAQVGDGWFPLDAPTVKMQETAACLREFLRKAGRDADGFGIEPRVSAKDGGLEECVRQAAVWSDLGATHIALNTMDAGLTTLDAHIELMGRFRESGPI